MLQCTINFINMLTDNDTDYRSQKREKTSPYAIIYINNTKSYDEHV
jgi:hypothetical protein